MIIVAFFVWEVKKKSVTYGNFVAFFPVFFVFSEFIFTFALFPLDLFKKYGTIVWYNKFTAIDKGCMKA